MIAYSYVGGQLVLRGTLHPCTRCPRGISCLWEIWSYDHRFKGTILFLSRDMHS